MRQPRSIIFGALAKKVFSAALLATTIGAVVAGPTFATYQKTAINGSNFAPGQTVQVEIRATPPTSITIQPVEAVFVIDTSNSIASKISTFKSNLTNFANGLTASTYGHLKIGLVTFGYDGVSGDDNPQITYPMKSYFSNNAMATIASATDVTNFKNAINSIQARPTNDGFSDIQAGLYFGNNLFSSSASNGKYLSLLTDGVDNMPASGSYFSDGSGNFQGKCVLDGSGKPTITPKYTQLNIADASTGAYVPDGTGDTSVSNMGNVNWPCTSYLNNVYGGSVTGSRLLSDMTTRLGAYPNAVYKTDLSDAITRVNNSLTPSFLYFHDIVNTSIMYGNPSGASITNGNFYNCDNNASLSNGYMFAPNGRRVDAQIGYVSGVTNYCFRFNVVLQSGVAPGTYAIDNPNDTSTYTYPYNTVQYYNQFNDVISQDYIDAGSINIVAYDLGVNQFNLANSVGTPQSVFTTSDNIYVHFRPINNTAYTTPTGAVSQIFTNAASPVASGTASDIGMSVAHGQWGANAAYNYDSWPNGSFNASYSGPKSWTKPVGDYTARAFVNYQTSSGPVLESNYTNNQDNASASSGYSVITPPVQQAPTNISCTSATVNWGLGSSNITGYKVNLSPADGGPYPMSAAKTATSLSLTSLKENTTYTWTLIASTINGDYTVPTGANSTFTTTYCPHFDVKGTTINATPFNNSSNAKVGQLPVSYTSPSGTWNNGDKINSTIVAFQSGVVDCSKQNAKGAAAATTTGGVTFTFSNGTSSYVTSYNGSAIPLNLSVTPTATTGTYTACVGSWSPVSPDLRLSTVTININMTPWFQVGGPTDTSTSAGDVFSNGGISFMPVPYSPLRKYFFVGSSQGVVVSNSLVGILLDMQSSGADWRATNYPSTGATQKTLDYSAMLTNAGRNTSITTLTGDQTLLVSQNCNNGKSVTAHVKNGNATLTNQQDFNFGSGCEGVSLTYFVDGNLYVKNNVIDSTNSGTLVFVVQGNIAVDPSVTEMDGVYLFGGSFKDGTGGAGADQQLTIKGSLLGLAGQSPNANTGTFMFSNNQTGLQRELGAANDANTPAEKIYYQPKYLYILSNSVLSGSTFSWTE